MIRSLAAVSVAVALSATTALAQTTPKFEYGKQEEVKEVEGKASAQAGFILDTGNARSTALSGSLTASRRSGDNKLSADVAGAYARSEVRSFVDSNMNGTVGPGEIVRDEATTTKNWALKLRYDRFFTSHDSAYL